MSLAIVNDSLHYSEVVSVAPPLNSSVYNAQKLDNNVKTAAFSVVDLYDIYLYDGVTANATALTVTLPSATQNPGRALHFRSTRTGGGVASSLASSVVSLAGVAGTSIIATGVTAGSSAVIVSNGQAWQVVRLYQQV